MKKLSEAVTTAIGLSMTFIGGMLIGIQISAAAVISALTGIVIILYVCKMGGFKWLPDEEGNRNE